MRRMIEQRLAGEESGKRKAALDNPTWTKIQTGSHKGEWGARVESADPPSPGERIEMVRKDGTRSWMVVDEVVWSGRGVHVVSLKQEERGAPKKRPAPARREEAVPAAPSAAPGPKLAPGAPFVPVEIASVVAPTPPVPTRAWSPYQQAIFDEAMTSRGHVVVLARAGSGKTTTAEETVRRVPLEKSVLFTSFAKKIMAEIDSRFELRPQANVEIAGLNSYGFRQVRRSFRKIQFDADKAYKLSEEIVGDGSRPGDYKRAARAALLKLVSLMKATLSDTEQQADCLIDKYEIDAGGELDLLNQNTRRIFIEHGLALLGACKEDTTRVDYDDQIWFPVVLDLPCWGFDFVFIDETQDLSPAQLELSLRAVKKNGRIFAIGDDRQCHPAGTMIEVAEGETKPIEKLKNGDLIRGRNRSAQRMIGGRRIRIAERPYRGNLHEIEVRGRRVEMTPNHKLLARWTDRTVDHCVTYLMWRKGFGFRVGWCKLFTTSGPAKIFHFSGRTILEKADAAWILKTFESRTEASVYESIIAAKYGIPTSTFEPVDGALHQTEDAIRQIFKAVRDENQERGERVLSDHRLEFALPFYPWPGQEKDNPQGRRTYFTVYAANVLPELMSVPLPEGQNTWAQIEKMRIREYEGAVYSLDVEEDHSYAANGICVLNSIFAFRGADEDAIPHIIERLRAKILMLTISYRCAKKIAAIARTIVPDFESGSPNEGVVEEKQYNVMLREAQPGDFILSRTNAPLVKICWTLLRAGKKATIAGRDLGKGLIQLIEKAQKKGGAKNVIELQAYVGQWAQDEIKRLLAKKPPRETEADAVADKVACIDTLAQGATQIREIVEKIEELFSDNTDETRIVCSSTHRAKGLERERAWVLRNTYMKRPGTQESNLAYVAYTRAKNYLFFVDLPTRGEDE